MHNHNGKIMQGVKLAGSKSWDLAILDIMLPKMDGIELCRRVRAGARYIPIMILTVRDSEFEKESFSLAERVYDIVQKHRITAQQRNIELKPDCRFDLPFVIADIGLIERVLENLIANAIRFSTDGDTVTIRLEAENERIKVSVQGGMGSHLEN